MCSGSKVVAGRVLVADGWRALGASPWSLPALPSSWEGRAQHLARLRASLLEGCGRCEMLPHPRAPAALPCSTGVAYPCDPGVAGAEGGGLSRLLCLG